MREIKGLSKLALKNLCMGFMLVAIYLVMAIVVRPTYKEAVKTGSLYVTYFNIFVLLTYVIAFVTNYLKVYISFGCTRRNLFIGKNIVAIGLICVLTILDIIVYVLLDKMNMVRVLGMVMMSFLIIAGGGVLAMIINKYGMKGYVISCLIAGFIGGLIGSDVISAKVVRRYLGMPAVCCGAMIGSIIIYAVIEYFEWKMIYKYEIRA